MVSYLPSQTRPFDDEELEDTGERLLAIRRSQESLGWNRAKMKNSMVILWWYYGDILWYGDIMVTYGFVWKCCVPLHPMVLLIIIPFLNGYNWRYTPFSDIPILWYGDIMVIYYDMVILWWYIMIWWYYGDIWVCLKMLCTPTPNGIADHYPVFKWL